MELQVSAEKAGSVNRRGIKSFGRKIWERKLPWNHKFRQKSRECEPSWNEKFWRKLPKRGSIIEWKISLELQLNRYRLESDT